MSLKKYLKSWIIQPVGQIAIEYVLLLAVMSALAIAASSDFFQHFSSSLSRFQGTAMSKMGTANTMAAEAENVEENTEEPVVTNFGVYDGGGGW